jgi:hypothetical protein
MAPEYDYDLDEIRRKAEEYFGGEERRQLELRRLRAEAERITVQLRRERENREFSDLRFAENICERLQGKRLTPRAYRLIRDMLDHCMDRGQDHYFDLRRNREREEMMMAMEKMKMEIPPRIFKWNYDEEKKDFLDEEDMKL